MADPTQPQSLYPAQPASAFPATREIAPLPAAPHRSAWQQIKTTIYDVTAYDQHRADLRQEAVDNGLRDITAELERRGVRGDYSWRFLGSAPYYKPEAIWQGIARARAVDPKAFPGISDATADAWEQRIAAPHDQQIAAHARETSQYGWAPWLTGQFVGGLGEPESIPLMAVGAGGARSIAQAALRDAGINLATAAVQEPARIMGRAARGQDTSLGEAAIGLGTAAGLGAVAGPVLRGIGAGFKTTVGLGRSTAGQLADRLRTTIGPDKMTPSEHAAATALDREDETLATSPFTPGAGSDEHLARMNAATETLLDPAASRAPPAPAISRPLSPQAAGPQGPRFDPSQTPWEQMKRRIAHVESRGSNTVRPTDPKTGQLLSSAVGRYQVLEGTWLANIAGMTGTQGKSRAELLALRSNPAYQEAVMNRLGAGYRARLNAIGAPETAGNLYLLHFAGEGGGGKVLRAAADTPIEQLLTHDAIEANKFLKGKTAGEVIAWADRQMGRGGEPGPQLRREMFNESATGDAEHAAAQAEIDAEDAVTRARARVEQVRADEPDDFVPGFDDGAPIMDGVPFGEEPVAGAGTTRGVRPGYGEKDLHAFWADQQAQGRRRSAVWTLRDEDGRIVDWGHGEEDAKARQADRADATTIERVAPGKLKAEEAATAATQTTALAPLDDATAAMVDRGFNERIANGADEISAVRSAAYDRAVGANEDATPHPVAAALKKQQLQNGGSEGEWRSTEQVERGVAAMDAAETQWYAEQRQAVEQEVMAAGGKRLSPANDMMDAGPVREDTPLTPIEGFDNPDDVAALQQIDSLEHDLRQWLADDEAAGATVRLNDDGDVISAADALADLDADDAAIEAAWACMK